MIGFHRRPARKTLTVNSAVGYRRGMPMQIDAGTSRELVLVRRVVSTNTIAIDPYRGWRKAAHQARAWVRYRWRRVVDAVYGWFEKDDDD